MNGTWTSENERDVSIDEFMEATPTLEQVRTKRKASEDFGPTRLLRCCGDGQRIPITSPGNTRTPTALVAPISTTKDEDCGETWEDDEDDCPTLSPGTPATTSPSVGLLTRMNTPQDILASVANETLGHHSIKGQLSARNLLEASSHHSHHPHPHLTVPAYPLHH
ncbi:hypothetical protein CPB86DRAFT_385506 [Serendipita vermifera]|nr:hypothetical protein CPB86DRAFT_385506 [Serendipita vermifera]